ncbi:MAG: ZIP family metal transporter [Flavobacteriales bacterium]|nr:ZIP family metal transporter [Flavobacteriales bacterium]
MGSKTGIAIVLVIATFFLIPLLAGAVVQWLRPGRSWSRILLSFGGAFLLAVAVLHMLPELYESGGERIGLWLLGGFMLQVVLEHFSHGIEHGHMHAWGQGSVPFVVMLGLGIHAFVEGLPFAEPAVAADRPFLIGVLLHKFPMALALASLIRGSDVPEFKGWLLLIGFASAGPLGIVAGGLIGHGSDGTYLLNALAIALGMLLHISTTIIFESAPDHRFDAGRSGAVVVGALLALLLVH